MPTEEQEREYNLKYGYTQRAPIEPSRPRYRLEGKPGAWEIIDGITVIDRVSNRGHGLSILKGLRNPNRNNAKVRYSFRKVYAYLQANGWSIDLNSPPDVYWSHPCGMKVKENRQLGPRDLLLTFSHSVGILQDYWTWCKQRVRKEVTYGKDRDP